MRNQISSVTLVIALVVHFGSAMLGAHEFERGHVERSIDVIVRGDKIEVKYALGLSDETIVDWLVAEGAIEVADEQRFRKCVADYEAESNTETDPIAEPAGSDKKATPAVVAEPLAFQTELIGLLKEKLAPVICDKLKMTSNQVRIDVEEPVLSTSPRLHVAMEIVLRATLTKVASVELSVIDGNFLEIEDVPVPNVVAESLDNQLVEKAAQKASFRYFGNVRLACRVKGDAVQLNSNVAPVLARAQAVDIELLDLEQRVAAASIVTRIGFVKSRKK